MEGKSSTTEAPGPVPQIHCTRSSNCGHMSAEFVYGASTHKCGHAHRSCSHHAVSVSMHMQLL
eukprot:scaffold37746_cov23-Tisochrysis_lutea.AAC.3